MTTAAVTDSFRSLMASFPTGVAVVTAFDGSSPRGMTVSSLCSATLTPPTLLVCLRAESPTLSAVLCGGVFSVNLLHANAQPVAELFASGDPDRFKRVGWISGAGGPHLVDDAHMVADCKISKTSLVGDHVVVFGEVMTITSPADHDVPLLYGLRRFSSWQA
ncbi:FMN reductase (NADH) RutF [Lentzea sp. NBRC 105346]|uniref:flavin reductase family protein n=1 Tax=Lentzea sp. NBRC 105346 TaxID=3032205 RepID=UPI0024A25225|nr:flavin reductase family protein [Lentzea sp. NBRC 105346]GLZ28507.1 FMN reductase (NADH) RutF [Lentzea sp. NBRC 105346]